MQKETILKKIKVLLGLAKEEFTSIKLEDGSELAVDPTEVGKGMADSLEVGKTVYDTEGNPISAGDYVLEDGTKITVDENSVITVITPKDTTEPEQPEQTEPETEVKAEEETPTEPEQPEQTEPERALDERVTDLEVAVNDIYEAVLAITEQLKNNEAKVDETVESFKAFKSQPAAQPLEFNVEKEDNKMSRFEKLKSLK